VGYRVFAIPLSPSRTFRSRSYLLTTTTFTRLCRTPPEHEPITASHGNLRTRLQCCGHGRDVSARVTHYCCLEHHLTRPSSRRNQQSSPLLRLPAEIRNTIYEYVLGGESWHYLTYIGVRLSLKRRLSKDDERPEKEPHFLALFKTCRQLQAETKLLPFKLNLFPTFVKDLLDFLRVLSPSQASVIHTIQAMVDHCDSRGSRNGRLRIEYAELVDVLVELPSLRRVEVDWNPISGRPDYLEEFLKIFEKRFEQKANGRSSHVDFAIAKAWV
jgi:hypothetical protein